MCNQNIFHDPNLQHAVSKLQKFTPKQISENKLKAFSIGNMGRAVPAKDIEERKKRREEEEALKNVQNEFVEHFDDKPTTKIKMQKGKNRWKNYN